MCSIPDLAQARPGHTLSILDFYSTVYIFVVCGGEGEENIDSNNGYGEDPDNGDGYGEDFDNGDGYGEDSENSRVQRRRQLHSLSPIFFWGCFCVISSEREIDH